MAEDEQSSSPREDAAPERTQGALAPTAGPAPAEASSPPETCQGLKQQAARDLRRQKQLGVAAGVAVVAFLFLVYLPSMATLADLHQQISSDAYQLRADSRRARKLPEVRSAADLLEHQLSQFRPVPSRPEPNSFMSDAADLATQLSLRSFKCKPLESSTAGLVGTTPVQLSFSGEFENVYTFLRRTEQLPRLMRIHDLKIKQRAGDRGAPVPGFVDVEMTVHLFFLAEETSG